MFKKMVLALMVAAIAFTMVGCAEEREAQTYEMNCAVIELDPSEHEFTIEREDGHIFDCVIYDGFMPKIGDVLVVTFDDNGTDKMQDDAPTSAEWK